MDVEQYLRKITPINIIDLIDRSTLQHFLNGYSYALNSGITVIFSTAPHTNLQTLDRIDAFEQNALTTFNHFCAYWRDPDECGQAVDCVYADKSVALHYFTNIWKTPKIYRCRPLALWDMTFPLTIEGQRVGVLFGGQIIVNDQNVNWTEALKQYSQRGFVDWDTCPPVDTHVETIEKAIRQKDISDEERNHLLSILHDEENLKETKTTISEFLERIKNFLMFGETTQKLLNELYIAHKTAIEQQLLRDYTQHLAALNISDEKQWWEQCSNLVQSLLLFPEIERIYLYVRERSRYICYSPYPDCIENKLRVPARDVVLVSPSGRLLPLDTAGNNELIRHLGLGQKSIWGYRSETGTGHDICSSVVVIEGDIPTHDKH